MRPVDASIRTQTNIHRERIARDATGALATSFEEYFFQFGGHPEGWAGRASGLGLGAVDGV